MKLKEKMAEQYRRDNLGYHDSDGVDVAEVWRHGFNVAKTMAAQLAMDVSDRQREIEAYGAGLCAGLATQIRKLGEDEAP